MRSDQDASDDEFIGTLNIGSPFTSQLANELKQNNWFTLFGGIEPVNVEALSMFVLNAALAKKPMVTLFICSPGGEEDNARAAIGAIEFAKAQGVIVRAFGAGIVASAAFDIFIACSKGFRFVHEVSMLMTHSSAANIRNKKEIDLQEMLDEFTLTSYTRINKVTRKKYLDTGDWYMSPAEAVELGVADSVITLGKSLPEGPVFPPPRMRRIEEPPQIPQETA